MQQHALPRTRPSLRRSVLAATMTAAGLLGTALVPGAQAAENPYERGPAPTVSSIEASRGSYSVSDTSVSSLSVSGFGGGTIYL